MQSASRSTPSFQRWSLRALPALAAVLALVSPAAGQTPVDPSSAPVTTTTVLSTQTGSAQGSASGLTTFRVRVSPAPAESTASPKTSSEAAPTPAPSEATPAIARPSVTLLDTDSDGQVRSLGSTFVDEDGTASIAVAPLPAGSHAVRAIYSGTATSAGSTSAAADLTAQASPIPDFAITATPATLNVNAGVQGTVAVTITPTPGFSNYVSLSCAGLPLFTTCSFLPSNVSVAGAVGGSTMTLDTVAPSGKTASLRQDTGLVYAFLLPGALGLVGLGLSRHRGLRMLALLCVVGSLIGGASSCAQRYRYLNFGPSPNLGTPNGQSIIRIYGTAVKGAQSTVRCFQITLNVTSTNTSGSSGNILTPCS